MNFKAFLKNSASFLTAIGILVFYWGLIFPNLWKKEESYMGVIGVLVGFFWIWAVCHTGVDWYNRGKDVAHEYIDFRTNIKRKLMENKWLVICSLFFLFCNYIFLEWTVPILWKYDTWWSITSLLYVGLYDLLAFLFLWYSWHKFALEFRKEKENGNQ